MNVYFYTLIMNLLLSTHCMLNHQTKLYILTLNPDNLLACKQVRDKVINSLGEKFVINLLVIEPEEETIKFH